MSRRFRPIVLEAALVLLFFTLVAIFATWPLAIHPLGGFYGFGNDNWGGIPFFGWLHDAYVGPGDPSFDPEFQAPYGLEVPVHAMQPMDRLFSFLFGGFDQGLGTYNFQIFSSFVLAGCTMYLAARYLTESRLAAAVAGFTFTFSPFHLALAMQYNALASIQWIPLYVLALIVLLQHSSKRNAVLTGAAFALVALTSYYYAWFLGWFTALVLVYFGVAAAVRLRRKGIALAPAAARFLRLGVSRGAIAVATALVLVAPFVLASARGAAEEEVAHPITEAVRYSARPWMFVVPPQDNPIVGERVRPWVLQHLFESPVYEQSIYVGFTVLALSLAALWPRRRGLKVPARAGWSRGLLVAGALAGALIMIGPYIPIDWGYGYWRGWQNTDATARVPSLGWLMFELGPMFRFFTRAFVLVSACLALLAAIGFTRLERLPWMTPGRRATFAVAVIGLVGLEFANAPPHAWVSDKTPAWVEAVRDLPGGSSVVDYPAPAAFSPRSLYYMFWQTKHRQRTVNPSETPKASGLAAMIMSPDDPSTGQALRQADIDYAVIHTKLPSQTRPPYQPQLPDDSMMADAGALNPWFREAARTDDAVIYRVLSTPRRSSGAVVRPTSGFGAPEPEGPGRARWMEAPTGTLTLFVTGPRRPLQLVLTVSSFSQPRGVTIRLDGRLVAAFQAPSGAYVTRAIPLGRPKAGRHTVELEARPGPQSISAVTGTADERSVSLRLREPIIVETPRRR